MVPNSVSAAENEFEEWPKDGLENIESCPICQCNERQALYSNLTDRIFCSAPGRWDLFLCNRCRSAYLDPRPSRDTISLAYRNYYTHVKPKREATAILPRWRRYARAMANGYRNQRYGGELEPASAVGPWLIPLFLELRRTLDREVRYLPKHKPEARLLDVGFGNGKFLKMAKRIGWQVSGADPDPVAVDSAIDSELDVRQGGIEAFEDSIGQFDVITLYHVIEHVHDPIETLANAFTLLKPGGIIYLETPNIEACGHGEFKEHWRGLEIPRHLVIFNWHSMIKSLNDAGFNVIDKKHTSFSSYAALASASRAIREQKDPYSNRTKKWRDVLKEWRLRSSPFTDRNSSEFITIIAQKPNLT